MKRPQPTLSDRMIARDLTLRKGEGMRLRVTVEIDGTPAMELQHSIADYAYEDFLNVGEPPFNKNDHIAIVQWEQRMLKRRDYVRMLAAEIANGFMARLDSDHSGK